MASSPDRAVVALTEEFLQLYPSEAARHLESLPVHEIVDLLERFRKPPAAVLERMTPHVAAWVLEKIDEQAAASFLRAIDPGHAAMLLGFLGEKAVARLLAALEQRLARELRTLMTYPADSAGRLMETRMATVHLDATAEEALDRLRRRRERVAHNVYLVDHEGHLVGSVALQDLALAEPTERLRDLVRREPISVTAMASKEEVVEVLSQRQLTSVPVADFEGRLLGVIRHDQLLAAATQEASVDMQTMVGASKEERALSRVSFAVRKRLPWLEINLATAFLAASVVGMFEGTIARFTALAVLLPVVAGQSGNTGAQALAVTMRGLALREIRPRHWGRLALKETSVALINGIAVALTTAAGVYVWSRSLGLAAVIAVSMVISMVAAGLSGASIPVLLISLGQDPAQASSIILTTVTDVIGFLSFLGIATLLASYL